MCDFRFYCQTAARAASGQSTTAPPNNVMKSRRRIAAPGLTTANTGDYSKDLRSAKWALELICTSNR
jgi:hypothetical protein